DPDKVIDALPGIEAPNLTGGTSKMLPNHHITKPVFIGEVRADGQFDVVWKTPGLVPGDAWSKFLPGSKDLIGDWVTVKCGNYNTVTKKCGARVLPRNPGGGPVSLTADPPRCKNAGTIGMRGFCDRFIALVLALGFIAALTTGVRAGPYEDALARFTADSFDETIEGINGVAGSGNALAATVIAALQEGRLFFSAESKRVFFKDKSDRLIDAATGEAVAGAPPADLAPVRLNNRRRRIARAAARGLPLMHPDPGKRLEAAQAVFRSKDANALPALEQAIAKETDPRVKQALIEARAAVMLYRDGASDADKIDAIAVIRQRGDQDALALLGGLPAGASSAVKNAAADAIASIENSLAIWTALQNTWYGLSLGSVLLLAAIGLAITFGVMGVINMAHGEMVMLGAY